MLRWKLTSGTLAAFVLLGSSSFGQERDPSPNALCVHSRAPLEGEEADVWITLPDHHRLESPAFSPDGKWIAFDAYRLDTKKEVVDVVCEVWKVQSDGGDPQKLAIGTGPRWSPDGKKLLFMREHRTPDDKWRHPANITLEGECAAVPPPAPPQQSPRTQYGVFLIDSDGAGEKFLCEGRWPDWSPDGSQIVFSKGPSNIRGDVQPLTRIYVANANGSQAEPLANGDCPAWSPDGNLISCCYSDPALPAPMIRIIEIKANRQRFIGYGWYRANWVADSSSVTVGGYMTNRGRGR